MEILLVYNNEGKTVLSRIRSLLKKMDIFADSFPVESINSEAGAVKATFDVLFGSPESDKRDESDEKAPACVLVGSALPGRWFDFFAGFSLGSHVPVLVYGEEAMAAMPAEFAFCFMPIRTESALKEYLEAGKQKFKKSEAARETLKARETLLRSGISVTEESLVHCVSEGKLTEFLLFIAAGFSPNTRDNHGVPLLNLSARKGKQEILRALLKAGADVNILADDRGTSALIDSSISKYYGIAEDLIKAGADVNIRSRDGQSALIVAAGSGDEEMTEIFLKAGADADIPDSLGVSARKYATLFHQDSIMNLFETYAPQKAV